MTAIGRTQNGITVYDIEGKQYGFCVDGYSIHYDFNSWTWFCDCTYPEFAGKCCHVAAVEEVTQELYREYPRRRYKLNP